MLQRLSDSPFLQKIMSYPDSVRAEKCRRSFFYFVQEFWDEIITEPPVYNWHIEYLCHELEKIFRRVTNRLPKLYDLVINIPPGTTKSTVVSVMFPAWCWIARNPDDKDDLGSDLRFITGSYASALSLEHAEYSRDIIRSDRFRRYFPEAEIRRDKDLKSNFKNNHGGNRFSTSVGSTVTGVHGHFIIIDDPLNPNQALSDTERDNANNWMDHTLSTRKVDKRVTVTILIMQRLHQLDCTGHLINKKGVKVRHIVLPGNLEYDVKPKALARRYVNGLLDPVRMPREVISDMRIGLGSYGYAGQVGQDPRPRQGGMFNRDWFEIVEAAPAGGTDWVRGWDLAGTTEKEAKKSGSQPAYTAGVRMKWVEGVIYIGHVARFRGSPNTVRRRMKASASQDPTNTIIDFPQDPGQAGKDQARSIASYLSGYRVRYSPESGDKVLRADPFSAQCEATNVKLVRGPWNEDYLDEVGFFPNGFKDQVDASVRGYNRLLKLVKNFEQSVGAPGGFKQENRLAA